MWWDDQEVLEDSEHEPRDLPTGYEPYTVTPDLSSIWPPSEKVKHCFQLVSSEEIKDGLGGKIPKETYEMLVAYARNKKGKWGDPRKIVGGDKPSKGSCRVSKSVMPSRMKFKGKDGAVTSELQKPLATPTPSVSTTSIQLSAEQSVPNVAPEDNNPTVGRRGHDPSKTDAVVCEVQRRLRSGSKKALLYFNTWEGAIGRNLGLRRKPLSRESQRIIDGYGMEFDSNVD